MKNEAIAKLDKELKDFKGGQKEKAVSPHVAKTLKGFCKEEAFAEAVSASKKTLSDCCSEVMKGAGNYVSDFEVYKKAAQFYFPAAKVSFRMEIEVSGATSSVQETEVDQETAAANVQKSKTKKPKVVNASNIQISLDDMF